MSPQLFSSSKLRIAVAGLLTLFQGSSPVWTLYSGQAALPVKVSKTRGKALFTGVEPMIGRLREHQDTMPASVLTCSNCHAYHYQPKITGSDSPVLSPNFLNERRSRRNGPESAYDSNTFCRVLRTGFDPVYVLLDHTMPIYELSDAQCQSLWQFLQQPDVIAAPVSKPNP